MASTADKQKQSTLGYSYCLALSVLLLRTAAQHSRSQAEDMRGLRKQVLLNLWQALRRMSQS